jgi:hypothetical protein
MAYGPVYSVRFVQLQNYTGYYTLTNDTGQVWVLRDLDAYCGAVVDIGQILLRGDLGQVLFSASSTPAQAGYFQWRGRQIIQDGESLTIDAQVNGWDATLSGYSLAPGT